MPACTACNCRMTGNSPPRRPEARRAGDPALFPLHDAIDEEFRPEARPEIPLERFGVVARFDPFKERDAVRLPVREVAFEERVQNSRLGEPEMPEAERELPQCLGDRTSLVHDQ